MKSSFKFRYAIHPGIVQSADGVRHFHSFTKLVELYGVDINEAVDASRPSKCAGQDMDALIHLHPLVCGGYRRFLRNLQRQDVWEIFLRSVEDSAAYYGTVRG